ncbi:FGGY-family carbohydrate kinase [Pleomorphomonas sp. PLEO]|uniref:FGGY-family carbohydrate kinase n=1 Tax=Pleomorphomonas sp. PLEO TaxID=3239306 RepID=UPI00351F1FB1
MPIWLGIDCGGTFLKAGLYDETGRLLGLARSGLPVLSDEPGWAERDMEALWQATCRVIADVLARSGVASATISGIGISAQGKGLFLLDREQRPLGRAMLSSDQRALDKVRAWQREGLPEKLYPRTLQTLWTGHPVSLLRWLKDERPAVYERIGSIMMAHDYLRFRLTGTLGAEITNISESNLYDMRAGRYDAALAGLCGIDEIMEALPSPVGSAEIVGGVTIQAAADTGLAVGTPVVGGLFDVVATSLAAGIGDERRLNAVLGTWSVATGVTDHVADGLSIPFVYGHHAEAGLYIVHDASPTSAANLEWLAAQFADRDYAAMDKAVAALPPAASDVIFLPFLYGSNAGLGMKAGFYGLQALHGRAHLLQAVYEGVVFSFLQHLDRLRQRFPDAETLRVTGGPARSEVWMQMLADTAGLPLELPAVEETGCLGAAMAAAVGTGTYRDFRAAMAAFEPPITRVEPVPSRFAPYARKRTAYRELIAALAGYEERLATLRSAPSQGTAP